MAATLLDTVWRNPILPTPAQDQQQDPHCNSTIINTQTNNNAPQLILKPITKSVRPRVARIQGAITKGQQKELLQQ